MDKEAGVLGFLMNHSEENTVVSFSGGKDSLVALDLSIKAGIKKAVFSDTTIEFEETIEYVKLIREFYNIKLDIVSAPKDFFEVVRIIGSPSRRMRWCCEVFKFGPLAKYAIKNNVDSYVTGLRKEESNRRANYSRTDKFSLIPATQLNPILNWTEKDVWDYIKKYNLPYNPLYKYFDRIGCWCCPYKTENEWKKIEKYFPELYDKLCTELEMYAERIGIKNKEEFIYERGWTRWAPTLKKIGTGTYSPCGRHDKKIDIFFNGKSKERINRITSLLPILTEDYRVINDKIRISLPANIPKRKLNTLIEKAINCIGCGACISTCKQGALFINGKGYIEVDKSECTGCLRCLHTGILRGACIVRNYSPKRKVLKGEI